MDSPDDTGFLLLHFQGPNFLNYELVTIFFSIIYDFKLNCTVNTGWKIIFLRITALLSLPLFFLLFCCENDVYALAYLRIGSYAPGSLCNVSFPMASFTCIVTSQVFVEIWMRWSMALSSAFYRGREHLWKVFSFNYVEGHQAGNMKL